MTANQRVYLWITLLVLAAFAGTCYMGRQQGAAAVRRAELEPLKQRVDSLMSRRERIQIDTVIRNADTTDRRADVARLHARKVDSAVTVIDSVHITVRDTVHVVPVEVTQRFAEDSVALAAEHAARLAEHEARVVLMSRDTASQRVIDAQRELTIRLTDALNHAEKRPSWKVGLTGAAAVYGAIKLAEHFLR